MFTVFQIFNGTIALETASGSLAESIALSKARETGYAYGIRYNRVIFKKALPSGDLVYVR